MKMNWKQYSIMSALFFVCGQVLFKYFLNEKFDMMNFFIIYSLVLGTIGTVLFLYNGNKQKILDTSKKDLFVIILVAITYFLGEFCGWNALRKCHIPGLNKISMILEILLVLIISYYFFNTKISQRQMIGVVLALFAIYLIIVDK